MLEIEQRLGVRIDSLLAVFVKTEYDEEVVVLGDLVADQELRTSDLEIVATTYNESGQVTGKEYDYIDLGKSAAPVPFALKLDAQAPPARIRLMAKPS